FKCFEDFKAEGFGRVNLIGGKDNVGKTAFMEAVYVNVHSKNTKQFTYSTYCLKMVREKINILMKPNINYKDKFMEQSSQMFTESNIHKTFFEIKEIDSVKKYYFNLSDKEILVNFKEFSFDIEIVPNIIFIDNFGLSTDEIINNYSAIQKRDEESYLNSLLEKLDSRIKAFKIIYEKPQCKVNDKYFEVTEFGDGVRHLISIITSIYKAENGYLFIDEIDNGIHYTMFDELWKVIIEVSKKLNVQVFATTHSKECIESYARVAKKLEDEEIKFIELFRHQDKINIMVLDNNMLEYQLEQNHEVR
ncbi:MAG: hypothetical protein DSZ07_00690, partial [Sulfurovum sp.]